MSGTQGLFDVITRCNPASSVPPPPSPTHCIGFNQSLLSLPLCVCVSFLISDSIGRLDFYSHKFIYKYAYLFIYIYVCVCVCVCVCIEKYRHVLKIIFQISNICFVIPLLCCRLFGVSLSVSSSFSSSFSFCPFHPPREKWTHKKNPKKKGKEKKKKAEKIRFVVIVVDFYVSLRK